VRGEGQRGINELRWIVYSLLVVGVEGSQGAAELGEGAGLGAVVGLFGGGVAEEELEGAATVAVVEADGPVEVAGAEEREVVGPFGGEDEVEDERAEGWIGVGCGEGGGFGVGGSEVGRGHPFEGGAVAPVVGVLGAEGVKVECGLHGS
jgi:hypothetical protein